MRRTKAFFQKVEEDWIDYNGHMNVSYYVLSFDRALDDWLEQLGFGPHYRKNENKTFFAVESHIRYEREAHAGEVLKITAKLVGVDDKRLQLAFEMTGREDGVRRALQENMVVHVDFKTRKAAAMDKVMRETFESLMLGPDHPDRPAYLGRAIRQLI